MTASAESPLVATPLKSNPGIYFEEVGRTSLYSNIWELVVYYDLQDFRSELHLMNENSFHAKKLCEMIEHRRGELTICDEITHQMDAIIATLEQNSALIQSEHIRHKRGLFNAVGSLSKTLFGTLDADDAAKYDEKIDNLKNNQRYYTELLKNHTTIIDTTVNIFNNTRNALTNQFAQMSEKIRQLMLTTDKSFTDTLQLNITSELETMVSLTTLMLIRYQSTQNVLIDLVTNVRHGRPHPLIITPRQLQQSLDIIQKKLPNSLTLPVTKNKDTILLIYQLSSVRTAVYNDKIIFNLKIPLPFKDNYQLFKVYPLPTTHGNKSIFIQPSLEYLVVDYNREHYYSMNKFDFQECRTTDQILYLCRIIHPIFNVQSENNMCEIDLLKHSAKLSNYCEIRTAPRLDYWIQLSQPNKWLYSLRDTTIVDTICGDKINSHHLQNAGILELAQKCYLRSKDLIIQAHTVKSVQLNNHYLPSLNITYHIPDYKLPNPESGVKILKFHDHRELQELSKAINEEKQHEEMLYTQTLPHKIHHYTISYISLVLLIAVLAYLLYKKIKCGTKTHSIQIDTQSTTNSPPQPQERNTYHITLTPNNQQE